VWLSHHAGDVPCDTAAADLWAIAACAATLFADLSATAPGVFWSGVEAERTVALFRMLGEPVAPHSLAGHPVLERWMADAPRVAGSHARQYRSRTAPPSGADDVRRRLWDVPLFADAGIPVALLHLLDAMMHTDPVQRLDVDAVLAHPAMGSRVPLQVSTAAVERLGCAPPASSPGARPQATAAPAASEAADAGMDGGVAAAEAAGWSAACEGAWPSVRGASEVFKVPVADFARIIDEAGALLVHTGCLAGTGVAAGLAYGIARACAEVPACGRPWATAADMRAMALAAATTAWQLFELPPFDMWRRPQRYARIQAAVRREVPERLGRIQAALLACVEIPSAVLLADNSPLVSVVRQEPRAPTLAALAFMSACAHMAPAVPRAEVLVTAVQESVAASRPVYPWAWGALVASPTPRLDSLLADYFVRVAAAGTGSGASGDPWEAVRAVEAVLAVDAWPSDSPRM
jgi:hypothetical protein